MKIAIVVFIGVALISTGIYWCVEFNKKLNRDMQRLKVEDTASNEPEKPPSEAVAQQTVAKAIPEPTFEDLLDAIEWVESRGIWDAVGDNGQAVGSFQIHKIYVRDVNRIDGKDIFRYNDRLDKALSHRMVDIYTNWYASRAYDELCLQDGMNTKIDTLAWFELAARCHNGGPDGWKKDCTKPYWEKVKARLEICLITE